MMMMITTTTTRRIELNRHYIRKDKNIVKTLISERVKVKPLIMKVVVSKELSRQHNEQ